MKDPVSSLLIPRKALAGDCSLYEREVDRWTRGLFYRRFKEPLAPDQQIQIDKLEPPEVSIPHLNEVAAKDGVRFNWIHVEPNIFSYYFGTAIEDKNVGIAIFILFNTEVYMASTMFDNMTTAPNKLKQ